MQVDLEILLLFKEWEDQIFLLASTIVVWRLCRLGFYLCRSCQGEQAQDRQQMTEPRPTLVVYGEVLVLQQDWCGLCSRWILSWISLVYSTRCWVEELLQNQSMAKITQLSQRTTATICSTGKHSWYQLSKDQEKTNCWTNVSLTEKNVTSRLIQNIQTDGMSIWMQSIGQR